MKYQFSEKTCEKHEQLHSEKVNEFDGEGIQGIAVIISSNHGDNYIIPKEDNGVDYHTQHHGHCPDEIQPVVSFLIVHDQNRNELETLTLYRSVSRSKPL